MKTLKQIIGLFTITAVIGSCSITNKVVTNEFIQKRKYNKGYYVSHKSKKIIFQKENNILVRSKNDEQEKENRVFLNSKINVNDNKNDDKLLVSTDNKKLVVRTIIPQNSQKFNVQIIQKNPIFHTNKKEKKNTIRDIKKQTKQQFKMYKSNLLELILNNNNDDDKSSLSGMALVSFILGILALVFLVIAIPTAFSNAILSGLFLFMSGILSVVGIIFSAIGLGQTSKKGKRGKGFAITGLVLSLLIFLIFLILLIVGLASM